MKVKVVKGGECSICGNTSVKRYTLEWFGRKGSAVCAECMLKLLLEVEEDEG